MENSSKQEIKKAFDNVTIKTTSQSILQAYEKQKQDAPVVEKKNRYPFAWSMLGLTGAIAIASLAVIIYSLNYSSGNVGNGYTPVTIKNSADQTAFELLAGRFFLNQKAEAETLRSHEGGWHNDWGDDDWSTSSELSKDQFTSIVDVYHVGFQSYNAFLTDGANNLYLTTTGSFSGTLDTSLLYTYKMTIAEDYFFLYNETLEDDDDEHDDDERDDETWQQIKRDESEAYYEGELHNGSYVYAVEFTIEQSQSNASVNEVEMKIIYDKANDSYLEIEYGTTRRGTSYSLTYVEYGNEQKEMEIELCQRHNQYLLQIMIEENGDDYYFECLPQDNSAFNLTYYSDEAGRQGQIVYTISGTSVTYVEQQYLYSITKIIK